MTSRSTSTWCATIVRSSRACSSTHSVSATYCSATYGEGAAAASPLAPTAAPPSSTSSPMAAEAPRADAPAAEAARRDAGSCPEPTPTPTPAAKRGRSAIASAIAAAMARWSARSTQCSYASRYASTTSRFASAKSASRSKTSQSTALPIHHGEVRRGALRRGGRDAAARPAAARRDGLGVADVVRNDREHVRLQRPEVGDRGVVDDLRARRVVHERFARLGVERHGVVAPLDALQLLIGAPRIEVGGRRLAVRRRLVDVVQPGQDGDVAPAVPSEGSAAAPVAGAPRREAGEVDGQAALDGAEEIAQVQQAPLRRERANVAQPVQRSELVQRQDASLRRELGASGNAAPSGATASALPGFPRFTDATDDARAVSLAEPFTCSSARRCMRCNTSLMFPSSRNAASALSRASISRLPSVAVSAAAASAAMAGEGQRSHGRKGSQRAGLSRGAPPRPPAAAPAAALSPSAAPPPQA